MNTAMHKSHRPQRHPQNFPLRRFALLALGLLLAVVSLYRPGADAATTWHVSPTGGGTACTQANPCATIAQAISNATNGDTIEVAAGTYNQHSITVNKSLTINGAGANTTTVNAQQQGRVFSINSSVTVTLSNLTITGGNTSDDGGGIRTEGALTVLNCQITGNSCNLWGGGLRSVSGSTLKVINSTVSNNTSAAGVSGGGGFSNDNGTLTVTNSTISGNQAIGTGDNNAGGIHHNNGNLTVINSTIANNLANGSTGAGGIRREGGTVKLRNTIIAANQNNTSKPDVSGDFDAASDYNLIGNVGSASGFTAANHHNQLGGNGQPVLNPLLDVLQGNGGPTKTHGLNTGSPAIDAGDNCVLTQSCPNFNLDSNLTTDQRGFIRPRGNGQPKIVDIGALEASPLRVTISLAAGQTDPASTQPLNFSVVFSAAVTDFTNNDVSLADSTANVSAATVNLTGSGVTYTISVANVLSDGVVQVSIHANAATDAVGNGNEPASKAVTLDTTPPTVTINQAAGQADPALNTQPINFSAVFSEPVTGFSNADVSLAGSTANVSAATITVSGSSANYTVTVSLNNPTSLGTVQASIPANRVTDLVGLSNTASTSSDNTVALRDTPLSWYVSPTGSGTACTQANPCATIAQAISNATNGDTIELAAGTYNQHSITVNKSLVLKGASTGNTIVDAQQQGRVFVIPSGVNVTLSHLTITGGKAPNGANGSNGNSGAPHGSPGSPGGDGGGVSNSGTLTLINSTLSNNQAGNGGTGGEGYSTCEFPFCPFYRGNGGLGGAGGSGGGLANSGTLNLINSTISNNQAGSGGSGGFAWTNTGFNSGAGGTGGSGGGLANSGTLNLINSTISNNQAGSGGSGSSDGSPGSGSGLRSTAASSAAKLRNSLVAQNSGSSGPDLSGSFTSLGYNLIGNATGGTITPATGDQFGTVTTPGAIDAKLGPLQNNGGPTQTRALLPDSPALDAASDFALATLSAAVSASDTTLSVVDASLIPASGGLKLRLGNEQVAVLSKIGNTLVVMRSANSTAATAHPSGDGLFLPCDQRDLARSADGPDADILVTVDIGAYELQPDVEDLQDKAINEDTALSFSFSLGDVGSGSCTITPTSSNTTLVPNDPAHLSVTGIGSVRALQINPASNQHGTTSITVTVSGCTSSTNTFLLTVNSVNDAPSFTKGANQTVNEDAPPQTISNWATNISAGPANEQGQTPTLTVTNNNQALFSAQPALSPTGTLTYTPAASVSGNATVTVQLQDNGGTANGGVDTFAQTFTITVNPVNDAPTLNPIANPPAIAHNAGPQMINLSGISAGGEAQTLTVTATSGNTALIPHPTVTYTSPNATGSLSYTPVGNTGGSALITVTVMDNGGTDNGGINVFSRSFTVTVIAEPTAITMHPTAQSICLGSQATFSVTATGANLTYQWRKGGTDIGGATSSSFTIPAVVAGDAGSYDVVVTGLNGVLTSQPAALTVHVPATISSQPSNQTVDSGSTAIFTAAATGTPTPTVQWQVSTDGGANFSNLNGATTTTLTLPAVTPAQSGSKYRAVFTNACATVTSSAATLTVTPLADMAVIVTNSPNPVMAGSQISYAITVTNNGPDPAASVAVSNNLPPNATLAVCKGPGGSSCSSAGGKLYTFSSSLSAGASFTLSLTATVACAAAHNSQLSNTANVTTTTKDPQPNNNSQTSTTTVQNPTAITAQPVSQTVNIGNPVIFNVTTVGAGLSYQWRKGGTAISGATANSYKLNAVTSAHAGQYDVVVTGASCAITSNAALLTVNRAPTITALNQTRQQGNAATNTQIAAVLDAEDAETALVVKVDGGATASSNGVTVSNLAVNAAGQVTANVVASCTAINASFLLSVTDTLGATANATLQVAVTVNTLPNVGNYPDTIIALGGSALITPTAAPTDNGTIASVTATATPNNFSGTFTGNTLTGALTITNANPLGGYSITVTITDNCGASVTRTFMLTVSACGATLSKISASFAGKGGSDSFTVTINTGCSWTAVSNAPGFITVSAPSGTSTASGTVNFSVANNPSASARSGTITVAGQTFTVLQGRDFADVPQTHPFYTEIGKLSARGITQGCGGGNFCPDSNTTREQMAIFIERALGIFSPPAGPATPTFGDVPNSGATDYSYEFIEDFVMRGITAGCAAGPPRLYCPFANVTREQMAIFILRALGVFTPPVGPTTPSFQDVPNSGATDYSYEFIEELYRRGVTLGCAAGPPRLYCPTATVTRAAMAVFLVRAFAL
jgi:hypothetical protein